MMNDLVQNSAHVPDQQQVHENITLPRTRFGGHHFVDRKRPTRPETQEHPDFKPTDSGKTEVFDGKWHWGFLPGTQMTQILKIFTDQSHLKISSVSIIDDLRRLRANGLLSLCD